MSGTEIARRRSDIRRVCRSSLRRRRTVSGRVLPFQRGQALVESLLGGATLFTLLLLVVILARYQAVDLAAVGASRMLAFECATLPQRCVATADTGPAVQRLRTEHFTNTPRSLQMLSTWRTRRGQPLLEQPDDVQVRLDTPHFGAGIGVAGNGARSGAGSAIHVLSNLAGPGSFGLEITGGLVAPRVQIDLLASQAADQGQGGQLAGGRLILDGLALSPRATTGILTDHWNASGPEGEDDTTVRTRVGQGQRLAEPIEFALEAAYSVTKGFIRLMGAISLEETADEFRHHEIDMDTVPPDRLGQSEGQRQSQRRDQSDGRGQQP